MEEEKINGRDLRPKPRILPASAGFAWMKQGFLCFAKGFWAWLAVNAWFSLFVFFLKPSPQGEVHGLQIFLLLLLPFVLAVAFQLAARQHHEQLFVFKDLFIAFTKAVRFLLLALWLLFLMVLFALSLNYFLAAYQAGQVVWPWFLVLTIVIFSYFIAGLLFSPALVLFHGKGVLSAWGQSVRGVLFNFKALTVSFLSFIAFIFPVFILFSLLLALLGIDPKADPGFVTLLLFPLNAYILALTYGSAYAAYRDVFLDKTEALDDENKEKEMIF